MEVTRAARAAVAPEVVTIAKTTVALAIGIPTAILAFNYSNAPSARLDFDFDKVNLLESSTGILLFTAMSYAGCALITSSIAFLGNRFKRVSFEKTRDWNVVGTLGCAAYNFLQLAAIQQVELQAQTSEPSEPVQPTWWEILFGSEQPPISSPNNIMVPSSDYFQENPDRFLISSCCLVLSSAIVYYGPLLIDRFVNRPPPPPPQNSSWKLPSIVAYRVEQGCTAYWNRAANKWVRQCRGIDTHDTDWDPTPPGRWIWVRRAEIPDFDQWLEQTEGLANPNMPPPVDWQHSNFGCTPYWNREAEKWVLQLRGIDLAKWDASQEKWTEHEDLSLPESNEEREIIQTFLERFRTPPVQSSSMMPPHLPDELRIRGYTPYWNQEVRRWVLQLVGKDIADLDMIQEKFKKRPGLPRFSHEQKTWDNEPLEGLPNPRVPPLVDEDKKLLGYTPYWNQASNNWVLQLVGKDVADWDLAQGRWTDRQDLPLFNTENRSWGMTSDEKSEQLLAFAERLKTLSIFRPRPVRANQNNNNQ